MFLVTQSKRQNIEDLAVFKPPEVFLALGRATTRLKVSKDANGLYFASNFDMASDFAESAMAI